MTKGQVHREVARLQKAFELCQWDIHVRCVAAQAVNDEGSGGIIQWDENTLTAFIDIAMQRSDEDIHETLLHEMNHLALVEITEVCNKLLGLLSREAAELGKTLLEQANEQTTVRLTRAFVALT